ncbi:hypothetical protein NliqN6_3060 [Naganishia liquefaciens]|uniref:Isopenicillin N synthase-like Fe(2+) 2OG dioxygenase domain-containing protein n=1 Tax=Naganishia liquefaciens TaxID=104408 RepID=A0A8H3TTM1_9TREE|nr:hypothetical protein NliqN6_3060 [Naganishia liquefaciens]
MPIAIDSAAAEVGIADLNVYLQDPSSEAALAECRKVAESLILTGALIVKDSRADQSFNDRFLDLLENYFAQDRAALEKDLRPELGYQVGVTLEDTERPSCVSTPKCMNIISSLPVSERPLDLTGHSADPKSRFFWRMTEEREKTGKKELDMHEAPNVVPEPFKDVWQDNMEGWGSRMKQAVQGVAEMLSVGLGLPASTIYDASRYGSHLLAPTATDLNKYGQLDSIFAGFHSDLNFLTIHGKSRYPGLHIWARNTGKKMPVKVPDGCLLVQAGKQLEWFSGGLVKAGYHEVVCTEGTLKAMERIRSETPERPLIRISSTFFYHLSPDYQLEALPSLKAQAEKRFGAQDDYGSMSVANQVKRELGLIALVAEE